MSLKALAGQRLLVTGVDGFVGRHVARAASLAGATVVGISRNPTPDPELYSILDEHYVADLRDEWPTGLVGDVVIHLAGRAAVGPSFDSPQTYISENSSITTTVCENLLALGGVRRLIGVSTGAVYAAPMPATESISENARTHMSSPYVVSKVLVENQLAYYQTRGLETVVARPFNHVGPGQGPGFLVPDLLQRLKILPEGQPLQVGNLSTARDYTDVRDIADAYVGLAIAPKLNDRLYNVASGRATSGYQILEMLCSSLGRSVPELDVDQSFLRPTDVPSIRGSADRLTNEIGWRPDVLLPQTIADAVRTSSG
ncbi:NAD-dependent epimerase/dehydratase family protein [Leucobacter albus]|uniref:NAD-dependent epimerase/dehydratase family protein n=1 Tax=Leucobacter albus TaxID=272210 RepID=A0ABW3TKZ7_9MICO